MAQALAELHVPFNVVVDRQVLQNHGYRVLVLPNVACMSDEEAEAITGFVQTGGAIVATGATSLYDEKYRIRDDFALSSVFGHHHGEAAEGAVKNEFGRGFSIYLPGDPEEAFWRQALPASLELIEAAVDYAAQGDRQVKIEAPNTTVINVAEKTSLNTTLIHLINYDATTSAADIAVELRKPEGKSLDKVTVMSPDLSPGSLKIEAAEDTGSVSFSVPHLRLYDLIVVEWK